MFDWFKGTPKIRVGDLVRYQWWDTTEVEEVVAIEESGEYVYPTEESRLRDEPIWGKKLMATISRKTIGGLPYMFPLNKLHKMTDDELMLWKLENA